MKEIKYTKYLNREMLRREHLGGLHIDRRSLEIHFRKTGRDDLG
jgi:hypothetical protein